MYKIIYLPTAEYVITGEHPKGDYFTFSLSKAKEAIRDKDFIIDRADRVYVCRELYIQEFAAWPVQRHLLEAVEVDYD